MGELTQLGDTREARPKTMLVRCEKFVSFKMLHNVRINNMFQGFTAYTGESNRPIVHDTVFSTGFVYWNNIGSLPFTREFMGF